MRQGELLAIRWADVDWDAQEVHIGGAISDGGPGVRMVTGRRRGRTGVTCR